MPIPAGRTYLCDSMGAGKPTFPKPGRTVGTSVPLTWVLYVHRREGCRECKAFKYGYALSTWPWVIAHLRSWSQEWDRRDKFLGTLYLEAPAYVSPIWNCRARLAGRRLAVTWSYIHTIVPPMTKVGTTEVE